MSRMVSVALAAAIAASLLPTPVAAQEPARSEIFGGVQWMHRESFDFIGGIGEVAVYASDWFGVGGELCWAGDYGFEGVLLSTVVFGAGPRFRFVNRSAVTPSVRALIGGIQFRAQGESATYLTTTFGGAVDFRANNRMSVRLQSDIVVVYFDEDAEHFFRLAGGVVVDF